MLGGPAPARSFQLLARMGILSVLMPELGVRHHSRSQDDRLERLLSRLTVLGEIDRGRRSFPTALYFGLLLYDEAILRISSSSQSGSPEALDELLRPFAVRARMSRRDAARMRAMFQGLKRIDPQLSHSKKKRRRRRIPMREFVRREYFSDALMLFRVISQAEERHADVVQLWEERQDEALDEPAPQSDRSRQETPQENGQRAHGRRRRRGARRGSKSGRKVLARGEEKPFP